ncbi:MAG: NAD-dependent epimerase/dehydratase family protein [Deltaproteobacteria bacterium]
MAKLLISGIAGSLGRRLVHLADGRFETIGIDRAATPMPIEEDEVRTWVASPHSRRFIEILEREQPDAFLLLPPASTEIDALAGFAADMRRLLELAAEHSVRQIVLVSTARAYGAARDTPLYLDEEAPLRLTTNDRALRARIEADACALGFLWQHPEIRIALLRPALVSGGSGADSIDPLLAAAPAATLLGFDPLIQLLHEEDLARAILLAVEHQLKGPFNLAGPGALPLHRAIDEAGGTALALPEPLLRLAAGLLELCGVHMPPSGEFDFLRFPCTVDDARFRAATGFNHQWTLPDIFTQLRAAPLQRAA